MISKVKKYILRKLGILALKETCACMEKELKDTKKRCTALEKENKELQKKCNVLFWDKRIMFRRIDNLEKSLYIQHRGLNVAERNPRIIVSLPSFPARISIVPMVLERIFMQTVRPDKVILWLSKEQFPNREQDLPMKLLEMKSCGLDIEWCDGDTKAYKKSLPALKEYPDDLVIIFDDDIMYDLDMIEILYEAHLQHPEAIIASRTHQIVRNDEGKIIPYSDWKKECNYDAYEIKEDWFFTGGAGTLFPPHAFGEEVFDEEAIQELCPYADDIWLNVHAAMNHLQIINTTANTYVKNVQEAQAVKLWDINVNRNDEQLKGLIERYREELRDTIYGKGMV